MGNINHSIYHGLELQLTKRLSRKWEMDASYTYSRNLSQAEDFESMLGDDPASLPQEYGYSSDDQRHVIKVNAIAFLPKDWQVGTTMSWSTGLPYSVVSTFSALDNFDYSQQGRLLYGYVPDRADSHGDRNFVLLRRNDHRNATVLNINAEAQKSFVLGVPGSRRRPADRFGAAVRPPIPARPAVRVLRQGLGDAFTDGLEPFSCPAPSDRSLSLTPWRRAR